MIALDEDALTCDLAETYGIYEFRLLPPAKIAVLACGLSEDSRIKRQISGAKLPLSQLLAAYSADKLANLVWMNSKDSQDINKAPRMIVPILLGEEKPKEKVTAYNSLEEFHEAMKKKYGG